MMKKIWHKRMAFALAGLMSFGASDLLTAASVQAASAPAYYQNEQQVKDKTPVPAEEQSKDRVGQKDDNHNNVNVNNKNDKNAPEAKVPAEDTKAPQPEKKTPKKKSSTSSPVTNAITTAAITSALAKGL